MSDSSGRPWIVSLVVTSALFGWGHGNQGITGIAQETLSPTACRTRWRSC
jgi:hypothetical protein